MKNTLSFSKTLSRLHISSKSIDIVRDPYKTWLWLCLLFAAALILFVSYDFYISHELQTGTLVTTTTQNETPSPIISETLLTQTAQTYGARAAALASLEAGDSVTTSVIDPSQ